MEKEIKDFIRAAKALNKIGEVIRAEYGNVGSTRIQIHFRKKETVDKLVKKPKVSMCFGEGSYYYGKKENSKLHIFALISPKEALKLGYDIYSPEKYKPKKEDICR